MLYTLDEVIDGWIQHISYHIGLTEEEPEPGTPDFTDMPRWTEVTPEWIRELVFAHPGVLDRIDLRRSDSIAFQFKNAAVDIMFEVVGAFNDEHGVKLFDIKGNRHHGYTSPRTKGFLNQSRLGQGF